MGVGLQALFPEGLSIWALKTGLGLENWILIYLRSATGPTFRAFPQRAYRHPILWGHKASNKAKLNLISSLQTC